MKIVDLAEIPNEFTETPLDNPVLVLKTCQDMEQLCDENHGIGLAAAQVGIPWKLCIIKSNGVYPEAQYGYFVNCRYEPADNQEIISVEGCLSLRSEDGWTRLFQVKRHRKIRLTGLELTYDKKIEFKPVDLVLNTKQQSVVFQHEIDHGEGILISSIGKEVFVW